MNYLIYMCQVTPHLVIFLKNECKMGSKKGQQFYQGCFLIKKDFDKTFSKFKPLPRSIYERSTQARSKTESQDVFEDSTVDSSTECSQ